MASQQGWFPGLSALACYNWFHQGLESFGEKGGCIMKPYSIGTRYSVRLPTGSLFYPGSFPPAIYFCAVVETLTTKWHLFTRLPVRLTHTCWQDQACQRRGSPGSRRWVLTCPCPPHYRHEDCQLSSFFFFFKKRERNKASGQTFITQWVTAGRESSSIFQSHVGAPGWQLKGQLLTCKTAAKWATEALLQRNRALPSLQPTFMLQIFSSAGGASVGRHLFEGSI